MTDATRRRINLATEIDTTDDVGVKKASENVVIRVNELLSQGKLTEDVISDYVALQDKEFLIAALACLTNAKRPAVQKIFSIKKPQMICAVCWKAGLSMRFAFRLQQEIAHIPTKELVYPRNGSDYPYEPSEMKWQLEFLGIE